MPESTKKLSEKSISKKQSVLLNWFNESQSGFKINPDEEVDKRLLNPRIEETDIIHALLTHLHIDHATGRAPAQYPAFDKQERMGTSVWFITQISTNLV